MKSGFRLFGSIALTLALGVTLGCGQTASQTQGQGAHFNPNPGGPGDPPVLSVTPFFNLFGLGAFPNRVLIRGSNAFIVNSGSNNIQKIDLANGTSTTPFFVSSSAGANPYDMTISGSTGYVTNFVANTVDVVNMDTGSLITTISGNGEGIFNDPEGIDIAANGLIFVANPDFDPAFNQGPGFITVIDSATNQVVNQIPTTQKNPQYVVARGNTVYVVNSGSGTFDLGCFCFMPVSDGGVDILDATTAATAVAVTDNIEIPLVVSQPLRGFPGSFAVTRSGEFAYLGSNSGVMYKINLTTRTLLRGNDNPIPVTPDQSDNLINLSVDPSGLVWGLSFNQDSAFLFNPNNDTVQTPMLSLDSDPSALEGPLDMAFRNTGDFADVYVLMSVSEELSALITN